MTPRVKLKNGELRDEIAQPLFDTIDIVDGESPQASPRSFFTDVQAKLSAETNLRQNSQLEGYVSYRILGMTLDSQNRFAALRAALPLIMEHSSLKLKVGEKEYYEGQGTHWAGRVRHEESVTSAGADQVFQHYGKEAVNAIVLGARHYIDIPPLQSFRVSWVVEGMSAAEITASTPGTDQKLRFILSLKGIQRRPVQ